MLLQPSRLGVILSGGELMRLLTKTDAKSFVGANPAAAVHFDAEWDESTALSSGARWKKRSKS
jgi:hypothetical protein